MQHFQLLIFFLSTAHCLMEYDNSIPGQPEITCSSGQLLLRVNTTKGVPPSHVFVKGHYRKDGCSFSNTSQMTFDFSKCDVQRQREVNPKGMAYSLTVIAQLHPLFTTKVDRAYRVRCFYKESEKAVGAEVSVSDPVPTVLAFEAQLPVCVYTIHKESPNGPLAKWAQIGDVLYHVWDCPSDVYEMFVHDCVVLDGSNSNNKMVVDSQGCSHDVFIMPELSYNHNRTRAIVSSNAFNFPDQQSVRFNCKVQTCPSVNSDCYRPKCTGTGASLDEWTTTEQPIGDDLDQDELITTPSTTTTTTTITLPTDFPTPSDPVFQLLKTHRAPVTPRNTTKDDDIEEGSGLEIMSQTTKPTKREIRRRDAIDVDLISPEVMIVDKDFANDLPSPQEQTAAQLDDQPSQMKSVCVPFFFIWILVGIILLAISITFTALCYSIKQSPRFHVLP